MHLRREAHHQLTTMLADTYSEVVIEDRVALMDRDPTCVVPGCQATHRLEIDHWRVDYHLGDPTELGNLARLCTFHHRMKKTHRGWRLVGGSGKWRWLAPGEVEAAASAEGSGEGGPGGGGP